MIREDWVSWRRDQDHLDEEIEPLLRALYETELVRLNNSCASKYFPHNQPDNCNAEYAYIFFSVDDPARAMALCEEIISSAASDNLEAVCEQLAQYWHNEAVDEVNVQWQLQFRPFTRSDSPVPHSIAGIEEVSTDEMMRDAVSKAFDEGIKVCKFGRWKPLGGL